MLKEVTAVYLFSDGKDERYRAWLDEANKTIFSLGYGDYEPAVCMSDYDYDAENDVYIVSNYSRISLMTVKEPDKFDTKQMMTLYKLMQSFDLYEFLRLYHDRMEAYEFGLERLL